MRGVRDGQVRDPGLLLELQIADAGYSPVAEPRMGEAGLVVVVAADGEAGLLIGGRP